MIGIGEKVNAKLGNEFAVHTCDQAIYDIALGLKVKKPQKYAKLILRMGGFHLALNFMGAIADRTSFAEIPFDLDEVQSKLGAIPAVGNDGHRIL